MPLSAQFPPPAWQPPFFSTEGYRNRLSLVSILCAAAIFVRFSYLHEILVVLAGTRLYLLYAFGVPAIVAVLITGSLGRVFRQQQAIFWMAFVLWMAAAVPFSAWPGGSAKALWNYMKVGPAVLVTIAGLITNWRQCKTMMWVFAAASAVGLTTARIFQDDTADRLALEFGSIKNSNDFAAHLLFLLPFLLWIVLGSGPAVLRVLAFLAVGLGLNIILHTASRGAMLAVSTSLAFFVWRCSVRQRIIALCLIPVAAVVLIAALPQSTRVRLRSLSASDDAGDAVSLEAAASSSTRQYLLQKGIQYTLERPIFGVGPGLFSEYEGGRERTVGTHGMYFAPHNSLIQVSSEGGIPALLLVLAAVFSTWRLLNTIYREAAKRPDCEDIKTTAFCLMLSTLAFFVAAFFLSLAYTFYLPAMTGLSIAVAFAAKQEFQFRRPAAPGERLQAPWMAVQTASQRPAAPADGAAAGANAPQRTVYRSFRGNER